MTRLFLLLSTLTFCLPAFAEQVFQYSGFGTLGLARVNSDYYGYRTDINSDNGTFKNEFEVNTTSVLGFQPEFRFSEQFDAVTQFTYRDRPKNTLDTVTSLAFLRYAPSVEWEFRIGRTALDIFHLSEYRDVGFAYPWAKAPNEVYGIISFRHLDGLDAMHTKHLESQTLRTKLFSGKSKGNYSAYQAPSEVKLDDMLGISFELESIDWSLTANYTAFKLVENIENTRLLSETVAALPSEQWPNNSSFAKILSLKNVNAHYLSLGARYYYNDWTFMSEVTYLNGDSIYIRPSHNGYISAIYNQGAHSFFAIYAASHTKSYRFNEDVDQTLFAELISNIEISSRLLNANQSSSSLGWRWNATDTIAVKAQWERASIKKNGASLWLSKSYDTPSEVVHSLLLNVSFIF